MSNHENHNEIMRALGGLEAKDDAIIRHLQVLNGRVAEVEKHADKMQSWQDQSTGKISMLAFGISFLVSAAGTVVKFFK